MFRNIYDTDCATWSPQGRIFQVEYAMSAVKQGTCIVGLRSKDTVILAAVRKKASLLADFQKKIFRIDDHIGVAISGLTADAKTLCDVMRDECISHKFAHSSPLSTRRLMNTIGLESQSRTQEYSSRPFGVGLLVAAYDATGAHLYETCPSGNIYEYHAISIGARCQSPKTYLESNYKTFETCSDEELLIHTLKALAKSVPSDEDKDNIKYSVAIVGKHKKFDILSDEYIKSLTEKILESSMEVTTDTPMEEVSMME